jgi:hypothetical protein
MDIDYDKIKKECPKAFDLFLKNNLEIRFEDNAFWDYHNNIIILCYCDLETFFDEQGILILYELYDEFSDKIFPVFYKITFIDKKTLEYLTNSIRTKTYNIKEAKEQAIYKAFEILEKLSEAKK